ncbi:GTP-binding protein [candidate division KSB1 bacterium]|nr:GTP-binding protein [candidate division KSB1 bacterium]
MIPTILITGFLGAGKTTLLNRLINHYRSKRTVLLVNEFGEVNIDAQRLVKGSYETVELNKGSLFCICVRTDFIAEVERIAQKLHPELLIIEATGMADTAEMENMLALPVLKKHIHLSVNVCVVDAQNFLKVKTFLLAPVSQVSKADIVIINKIDLVTPQVLEAVKEVVISLAPGARVVATSYCSLDLARIEDFQRQNIVGTGTPGEGRPDPVVSVTLNSEGSCDMAAWTDFVNSLAGTILRVKGNVTMDGSVFEIDATTDRWTQKKIPGQKRENRLVVIGKDVDQKGVTEAFGRLFQN